MAHKYFQYKIPLRRKEKEDWKIIAKQQLMKIRNLVHGVASTKTCTHTDSGTHGVRRASSGLWGPSTKALEPKTQ